jgi:hydroxymethylglutaryl-CoA reductase
VASNSRGMRLVSESGGVRARVLSEGLTQNPMLVYATAEDSERAAAVSRSRTSRT